MPDLLTILSDLSQVLGVPAALCLAWGAFIIHDHSKRITDLEETREQDAKELDRKLDAMYNIINDIRTDLAYIKGKFEKGKS